MVFQDLKTAVSLIKSFCEREYGKIPDFSNPNKIDIAYTINHNNDEIQICVDLNQCRLVQLKNQVIVKEYRYNTLAELNEYELKWLDFDRLIAE